MMNRKPTWTKGEIWAMGSACLGIAVILTIGVIKSYIEWSPPVAVSPVAVRPVPNGFDLYVAASNLLIQARPAVDAINDTDILEETGPAATQRYSIARKEAWRRTNAPAFAMLQRALQTPCMTPLRGFGHSGYGGFGRLRELARDMVIETHLFQMRHQPAAAVTSTLDVIQMGDDLSRGGDLLPQLVGSAIQAMGRSALEADDNTIGQLTAAQAKASARRLEGILLQPSTFAQAMRVERVQSVKHFLTVASTPGWRAIADTDEDGKNVSFGQKIFNRAVPKRLVLDRIQANFDEMDAQLAAPYRAQPPRQSIEDGPLANAFCIHRDLRFNQARQRVPLDLLLLRLALQAYHQDHGGYPHALAALSPLYLKDVPRDDFSNGQPFGYRLQGASYRLWSIGPDGVQNGGQPVPPVSGQDRRHPRRPVRVSPDSKGDWVAGLNQ